MMEMPKGYKTLLLALLLLLLGGCGARIAPILPESTAGPTPGEVPPAPTATPLLSPPPEAVPRGTPVVTPTAGAYKAPPAEGKHFPLRQPENWEPEEEGPAAETVARAGTYTVERGDCLWTIAETLYGSGLDWRSLWEVNREAVADPSLVLIGQVLTLPEA